MAYGRFLEEALELLYVSDRRGPTRTRPHHADDDNS